MCLIILIRDTKKNNPENIPIWTISIQQKMKSQTKM